MKLQFCVNYHTNWGEDVRVCLTLINQRNQKQLTICPLECFDGVMWRGEVQTNAPQTTAFEYSYAVFNNKKMVRQEWTRVPRHFVADPKKTFILEDAWNDVPLLNHLYTSAYTDCIQPCLLEQPAVTYFNAALVLKVAAPQLRKGEKLAVVGNLPCLGNWDTRRAMMMQQTDVHEWTLTLNTVGLKMPMEYKYVVVDASTFELIEWEGGDNRRIEREVEPGEVYVTCQENLRVCEKPWRGAGTVIPVFSLRSADSWGIGDFDDLKKMVDWVALTGQRALQLLPINDTILTHTWQDSYPYNSISVYALHPLYLSVKRLGELTDKKAMNRLSKQAEQLQALTQVDYEAVEKLKMEYFHLYYKEHGAEVMATDEFAVFLKQNNDWLVPYAVFCHLRDMEGTADFTQWSRLSTFNHQEVWAYASTTSAHYDEVAFFFFLQFELHRQMDDAHQYARSKGVVLKGDIPIGVSPQSVEAWMEPHYFNCNAQAGAPPDDFSANGQNWGFPTYNWEAMLADGCCWWLKRLGKMADYFDAYRIDHVLGFFRIWEIPKHSVHGLLGQFVPALPMSVEEIEGYGLKFRKDFFTTPYIADWVLQEVFGPHADYVKNHFLEEAAYECLKLKEEYNTQRKVQALFKDKTDEASIWIRDGLYRLISNVLFVPDRQKPDFYHPRISAQQDLLFRTLTKEEQEAFNQLYEQYYYHRHNQFWYEQAMRKLPLLTQSTNMLTCAEDLGMVPECVAWVMDALRILTLEIQRMPKALGVRFSNLQHNPYRSVSTISTHDMPTLRGWWHEDAQLTQCYYNEVLQKTGEAPAEIPGWLCHEVVARHLFSPSMLCLLSWQDWMSINEVLRLPDADAERINVPANPRHYWRYRMHMNIEQLMAEEALNNDIKQMVRNSGR